MFPICSIPGSRRACRFFLPLLLLAACSSRPEPGHVVAMGEATFPGAEKMASSEYFREYYLKPGDVLDVLFHVDANSRKAEFKLAVDHQVAVKFPGAPELNEAQAIRPDGTVSLPYLGVVRAAGLTVQQLTDLLRARYAEAAKGPYPIAPGELVTVKFVKHPQLNESQTVRPDGSISLPHLGVVQAGGRTVQELSADLSARYSKVLESPEPYVLVASPRREALGERERKLLLREVYVVVPEFRAAIQEFKKDLHTAPRGLSRLVQVRPDGHVTFPLLGDRFVAGKTIPAMNQELNQLYAARMDGLSVDLFLEQQAGANIYVLGEVNKPGAYRILSPTPLLGALALGGGPLPEANLERLVVVRRDKGKLAATRVDVTGVIELKAGASQFYLQPDDILYVPPRGLANAARRAREIAAVIFTRGWAVNLDPFRLVD